MLSSSAADDTCFDAHNLLLHKVHPNNVILVKQMWEEDKQKVESLNRKETNYHPSLHGICLLGYLGGAGRKKDDESDFYFSMLCLATQGRDNSSGCMPSLFLLSSWHSIHFVIKQEMVAIEAFNQGMLGIAPNLDRNVICQQLIFFMYVRYFLTEYV